MFSNYLFYQNKKIKMDPKIIQYFFNGDQDTSEKTFIGNFEYKQKI